MVRRVDELLAEVLELDDDSRAEFAERLLNRLVDAPSLTDVELAWLSEAEDRSAAYHRGEIDTFPAKQVLADLESGSDRRKFGET